MVKNKLVYVVRKEKFNPIKKLHIFNKVSNDLYFLELRGMGEELETKNMWLKFNMKIASSSTTMKNPFQIIIKNTKLKA